MELMRTGAHYSLGANTRGVKAHCKVKPKKCEELRPAES